MDYQFTSQSAVQYSTMLLCDYTDYRYQYLSAVQYFDDDGDVQIHRLPLPITSLSASQLFIILAMMVMCDFNYHLNRLA